MFYSIEMEQLLTNEIKVEENINTIQTWILSEEGMMKPLCLCSSNFSLASLTSLGRNLSKSPSKMVFWGI